MSLEVVWAEGALDRLRSILARISIDRPKTARRDINRLMSWIKVELRTHRTRAQREPLDSGYAGDLGHVRGQLIEVLAFLSNSEPDQIDKQLGEGR